MSYSINAGIEVSVGHDISDNPTTDPAQMIWYNLTDDNRQPVKLGYEVIEKTNRMADGTLRRYVVALHLHGKMLGVTLQPTQMEIKECLGSGHFMRQMFLFQYM